MTIKRKRLRIALGVILAAILFVCAGFAVYGGDYYHADEAAVQAMAAADDVTVSRADGDTIVFTPTSPKAGLIFYPGGKVEYTAYAPLMRSCAERCGASYAKCSLTAVVRQLPGKGSCHPTAYLVKWDKQIHISPHSPYNCLI